MRTYVRHAVQTNPNDPLRQTDGAPTTTSCTDFYGKSWVRVKEVKAKKRWVDTIFRRIPKGVGGPHGCVEGGLCENKTPDAGKMRPAAEI